MINLAFLSDGDPRNRRLWSGTVSQMFCLLQEEYNVIWIDTRHKKGLLDFFNKVKTIFFRLFNKRYNASFSISIAKKESAILTATLKKYKKIDYIFCPAKSSSIAYVKTNIPIIYLTDATFAQLVNYYSYLTDLCSPTLHSGNVIESRAINNSALIICASEWTKQSVINDYGKNENKLRVVHFGANLSYDKIVFIDKEINKKEINLLFCGVDWERKGGQIAVDTLRELDDRGYNANLYVVGCIPVETIKNEKGIHFVGFLDKNNDSDCEKLIDLYKKSDFLILPTKAECAGIVFAEASGFGIPSITFDTGGVGSYVKDNVNGYRLDLTASYKEFADYIEYNIIHEKEYKALRISSRQYYIDVLNWSAWKKKFKYAIDSLNKDL